MLTTGVPVETVALLLGNTPTIVIKHYAAFVQARQQALETAAQFLRVEVPDRRFAIQGGANIFARDRAWLHPMALGVFSF